MQGLTRHLTGGAGHLLLLAGFLVFAIWYANDAYASQQSVQNMLLIGPAAALAVALIGAIAVGQIWRLASGTDSAKATEAVVPAETPGEASFKQRYGTSVAALGLAVYVAAMPFIGFDVASVVFVALSMMFQGARNPLTIGIYALLVGLLPVWAIESILSVPVPTLFL